MIKLLVPIIMVLLLANCQPKEKKQEQLKKPHFSTPEQIVGYIKKPTDDYVLVGAHRGDWRNAPENSLQAIKNCIEMGVDIVEIDVRMTADYQMIVMHDRTLNRTSTGKGQICDWPLDSIQKLYLKNGAGIKTHHKIPELRDVMLFVKDKPVLINIDKAWEYLSQVYKVLKETGTINQAIFKGNEPLGDMRGEWGSYMDSIMYMPIVWPKDYSIYNRENIQTPLDYVQGFYENFHPFAFEVVIDKEDSPVFDAISYIKKQGNAIWIDTLWPELCAGHNDDVAMSGPDKHWGWVVEHGANIILTDRPRLLIDYLKQMKLH